MYNRSINQNAGASGSAVSLKPTITQPSSRPQAESLFTSSPQKFKEINKDTIMKNIADICLILQKMPLTANNRQILIPNYQKIPGDKIIFEEKKDGKKLFSVSNLYGLVVLILYVFNTHDSDLSSFIDTNDKELNTDNNPLIKYIGTSTANIDNIKQIYNVLMSFYNFTKYGFQELSVKSIDTLEKYLKELIKSDYQLKYFHDQYIQGKSPELVGKWQNLINQLTRLQLLIFIKKNKDGDDGMIDNLLTALNGKMKIVNNILAQNVSDSDAAPFEDDDDVASPSSLDLKKLESELLQLRSLSLTEINKPENVAKIQSIIDTAAAYFGVQFGGTNSSQNNTFTEDMKNRIISKNIEDLSEIETNALKAYVQTIIAPKILNNKILEDEEKILYKKYKLDEFKKTRSAKILQRKFRSGRGPQRVQLIKILQELKSIIENIQDESKKNMLLNFLNKLLSPKTIEAAEGRKNDGTPNAQPSDESPQVQAGGSLSSILGSKYYGKYLKYKSKYLELSI
uniref:Uncharacterized protein n=1 Tax=viral metagenome TaxID=1070528 RepID=A0A6C0EFU2_9ZZZZ